MKALERKRGCFFVVVAHLINFLACITHFGFSLSQPPVGADRTSQLGKWEEKEVKVSGMSWDVNGIDIAVAG